MNINTLDKHIEITPGVAGGKPRIAGRRITVQNIALWHEYLGQSADEIAAEHDLTLGDVYAALAFYFDNRVAIDQQITDDDAFIDTLRSESYSRLREKLDRQ